MGEGGAPVLERVVDHAERWGLTMDLNRHPAVFLCFHNIFMAAQAEAEESGDTAAYTMTYVDMLRVQERRRVFNQRSDKGALPTALDYRTAPFDTYVFQGMSQSSLVVYRMRDRRLGTAIMSQALEDAARDITHPLQVPEMLFFAARELGILLSECFPKMSLAIPEDELRYTPYTAPHGSKAARFRWLCDVVVPHRYSYYVETSYAKCEPETQIASLEHLRDYIRAHTDPSDAKKDVMPAAPAAIVSAALPRRGSKAEELDRRMALRREHSQLIRELMDVGFGEHSFLLHLEAATLARSRREAEPTFESSASHGHLDPAALEELDRIYRLEQRPPNIDGLCWVEEEEDSEEEEPAAASRKKSKDHCSRYSEFAPDDDDAHSQQFYNDISRHVSENSFVDAMVPGAGAVSYQLLRQSKGTVPANVLSSVQLAAAIYAVLLHAWKRFGAVGNGTACNQCMGGAERLYTTVRNALDAGHEKGMVILDCWRGRETCPLCGISVVLVSLVYQAVAYASTHAKPPPYGYLRRCNHMVLQSLGGLDVARRFTDALEFFCRIDDALEFQRHPWRFANFSYFPVERMDAADFEDLDLTSWEEDVYGTAPAPDTTAIHFDHMPVLAMDGSLYATRRVVDILYETSHLGSEDRERHTLSMAASNTGSTVPFGGQEIRLNARQCDMIQSCFTYNLGAYRTHMTNESHRELYLATGCRDRDDRPVPLPYTRPGGRCYATELDLNECSDEEFTRVKGILHPLGRDHIHAWPLVVRSFMHGSDPELFWSILWLKKHLTRHRGHAALTEIDIDPATTGSHLSPSRMLTPGDPLFRQLYGMLPALIEKAVGVEGILAELVEPFRLATADPSNRRTDRRGRVSYKVDLYERHPQQGTNNLYSALMTFVHAKENRLEVDQEVLLALRHLFLTNDALAAEKPLAASLLEYLSSTKANAYHCVRPTMDGDTVSLANPACPEEVGTENLKELCGDWPTHFILYDALLSKHVPRHLARGIFLGINRRRRRRKHAVLPAFIYTRASDAASTTIDCSLALSTAAYTEYMADYVDEDDQTPLPTDYVAMKELCMAAEVMARFRHTATEAEAESERLVDHLESDGVQVYRGLLSEQFIRRMAEVGSEPATFRLVNDTSRPLLTCRLELGDWKFPPAREQDARHTSYDALSTRDMFPAWKPFLGPVYLDRTLMTMGNVVYGTGELSPFTGSATHFLPCVAWHPITAVRMTDDVTGPQSAAWIEFVRRVARPVDPHNLDAVRSFRVSCDSISTEEEEDMEDPTVSPAYKRPRASDEGSAPDHKVLKRRIEDLRVRNGVTDEMMARVSRESCDPVLMQTLFDRTFRSGMQR